jgi:hypothetical protein
VFVSVSVLVLVVGGIVIFWGVCGYGWGWGDAIF